MNWDALAPSFFDELEKIGEFNLSGVSSEKAVLGGQPSPPFETPGVSKALQILNRMDSVKQAEAQQEPSGGAKKYRDAIALGARVAGGMGIGSMLGAAKTPTYRGGWHTGRLVGMGIGGGLGLADYVYRKRHGLLEKSSSIQSPAALLANSQKVGKHLTTTTRSSAFLRKPRSSGLL